MVSAGENAGGSVGGALAGARWWDLARRQMCKGGDLTAKVFNAVFKTIECSAV